MLAIWARDNGMHVQGCLSIHGYSAYIWVKEAWNEESFLLPTDTNLPRNTAISLFNQLASLGSHHNAGYDIIQLDHEKLANDLIRKRTQKCYVRQLAEVAYLLGLIDEYWRNRFLGVIKSIL